MLSINDMETLTLGVYQTKLAKRYTDKHMKKSGQFDIKLNDEFENVVRAKIGSRFRGSHDHNLWIDYSWGYWGGGHKRILLPLQTGSEDNGMLCPCLHGTILLVMHLIPSGSYIV